MIKHLVFFQFHEEAEGATRLENAQKAKALLESLIHVVPTLKKVEVGINIPNLPKTDYDLALYSEFDDLEGLNAYQIHPEHVKVATFIGKVRSGRAAVDYEI